VEVQAVSAAEKSGSCTTKSPANIRPPICFQYATIVPVDPIHIGYHMAAPHEERIPPNPSNPESAHEVAEHQPVASSKGIFFLKLLPKNGVFCLSLSTNGLKLPISLAKIFAEERIESPGAFASKHRIQASKHELNTIHNKGNIGKPFFDMEHYGTRSAEKARKIRTPLEWPWMHRHSNLARTVCKPNQIPFAPPEWVRRFKIETEPNPTPTPAKAAPKCRLRSSSRHRFRNFHDSTRHCFRSRDYPTSFVASRDRSDYFQDRSIKDPPFDMLWSTFLAFVSKEALQKMQPIVE